ncbi:hypothetical protein COHA_004733 [Chlorella ohadii]|uniref:VTT domain-containing protein n=1 Tax=Chlorella ohadii TaxID=2649997 RepID=A0AAD5H5F0_9CHLO|nr:hypothetical protein COHA_004733 [Chlorella ohadii]
MRLSCWAAPAAAALDMAGPPLPPPVPACPPSNRLPQPQPLSADHPDAQAEDLEVLRSFPPSSLQQLAAQRDVLKGYAAESPTAVAAGYCAAYLLMQTFAIPGTIFLSLLAGGLWGVWRGSLLVAVVSTLGSCCCYCMSWAVGQPLAHALWPDRLDRYAAEVAARRRELLNYIVFLRVTPILPNTFINVASPIVGVPLAPFALGTLLGCLPNNFFAVNAGSHLGELRSLSDL